MAKLSFKQLPGEQLSLFPENIYDHCCPIKLFSRSFLFIND